MKNIQIPIFPIKTEEGLPRFTEIIGVNSDPKDEKTNGAGKSFFMYQRIHAVLEWLFLTESEIQ